MPPVYLGTSGWAYPSWKPEFYPEKTPARKFLDYYATKLNAVEVNYTFRAFPAASTLENWITATPEDFRFALKANQRITHFKRLQNTQDILPAFVNAISPLLTAQRLGPILFQLPPQFKADPKLLDEFLGGVPGLKTAWEFRDQSWFSDSVFQILRKYNAALCIAESEERTTPNEMTADFCYFRFRKPPYEKSRLEEISHQLGNLSRDHEIYAFFKHEDLPAGAMDALAVGKNLKANSGVHL